MKVIKTKNLRKDYEFKGGTIPVLQGINLTIDNGEFVGIVGPSGSGKSTLMGILGGLLQQTSGLVEINGFNLRNKNSEELAEFRLKNIGFIFQSNYLIPTLTAIENIEVPLIFAKMPIEKRKEIALTKLSEVGIENKADFLYDDLSGGEKQRVGIARALANDPQIILADEPTGSLDSMTGTEIIMVLKSLAKEHNSTILIVSHDPSYFKDFNRILSLKKGILNPLESINFEY